MSILYILERPEPGNADRDSYAQMSHTGTWDSSGSSCKACQRSSFQLIDPLLIEWEAGNDKLGSFSWCGYTGVVTAAARKSLERMGCDMDFRPVTVCPPSGKVSKKDVRVAYPYAGPDLLWMVPNRRVVVDPAECGLQAIPACDACGRALSWRFKREGLVAPSSMRGACPFYIDQLPGSAMFASADWVREVRDAGLTNLGASECGVFR